MTQINISLTMPSVDGTRVPASGSVRFEPTKRLTEGDDIVLPVEVAVALDSEGRATVELTPTGVDWCWKCIEVVSGGTTRYVAVPDSDIALEYADLTDVDSSTLKPSEDDVPAWTAAVAEVQSAMTAAQSAESNAEASASNAATSAQEALEGKTAAVASAASASVSESHAAASATEAAESAASIGDQLSQAQSAAASAASSQASAAQSAQASAQSAQAAATSQSAAQDNATTATDAAASAQSSAMSAASSAQSASDKAASIPDIRFVANASAAATLSGENPDVLYFYPEAA